MKTAVNKSEPIQSKEKSASNQKGIGSVLQAYKEGMTQLQSLEKEPAQRKPNNTGLPDNLKSGIENLSGYSMDDVKVHYNSSQPETLQAHAYAQGTDIHVAPGQEKHLAHEAWHVVQQKQGRVKPTMQMKGTVPVNDDAGLEKEADVMGAKALQKYEQKPQQKYLTPFQMMSKNIFQLYSERQVNSKRNAENWKVTRENCDHSFTKSSLTKNAAYISEDDSAEAVSGAGSHAEGLAIQIYAGNNGAGSVNLYTERRPCRNGSDSGCYNNMLKLEEINSKWNFNVHYYCLDDDSAKDNLYAMYQHYGLID